MAAQAQLAPTQSPLAPAPPDVNSILAAQPARVEELNKDISDTDTEVSKIEKDKHDMTPPKLETIPQPTPQQTDPVKSWGSAAMLFAGLGSLFTRRPLTSALNASAQVFKAVQQKDQEATNQAYDSWKIANENALKMADFQQKQYKEALDNADKDENAALAKLRAKMVAFQDTTGVQALDVHGLQGVQQHMIELRRLQDQMENAAPGVKLKKEQADIYFDLTNAHKELVAAQASKDPARIKAATDKVNDAMARAKDLSTATGKGGAGAAGGDFPPEASALMAALAEQGVSLPTGLRSKAQQVELYKGLLERNPGKTPDEIAQLIKTGQIEFGAQKKETQTAAGIAGKVEVASNELKRFVPLVRQASADLSRSNFTSLNQLVQTADSQISDPKLKKLKGYIVGTLNAYDVLAARGGTDKEKRAENREQLLAAEGDRAINAALDVIMQESDIAHESSVEATRVPELPQSGPGAGKPSGVDRGPSPAHLKGRAIWPEGDHWVFDDGTVAK